MDNRKEKSLILRSKFFRQHKTTPYQRLTQFKKALFSAMQQNKPALFTCPLCKDVLKAPVTVECGHTFCTSCLDMMVSQKCIKCDKDVEGERPKVNILVQELVEKMENRTKMGGQFDIPDAVDILGFHPRYILRSGYSGLQFDSDLKTEEGAEINSIDDLITEKCIKFGNRKRRSSRFLERYYKENQKDDNLFQTTLKNVFDEVEVIKEKALRANWNFISPEDFECLLCSRCLLDPVTTACGHTFCRDCLTRVLDHRLACPLCVSPLSIADYFKGTTAILEQAIRFLIPEEFNNRLKNNLRDSWIDSKNTEVPVFVCTNAFPGVACPLYVYEPRYRLLVRRCLQTPTKRFAMASADQAGSSFVQYGTILEIRDAVTLEDGRIILTTVGVRRFRVLSKNEQDGYDTAKIEHINDVQPCPEKLLELATLHQRIYNKAAKWVRLLTPPLLLEVERLIGKMPKIEKHWVDLPDGPAWTWWLMPILPLSTQLQVSFLRSTSLEKRLRAIDKMLEHMKVRMKALQREETVSCCPHADNDEFCSES